MKKRISPQEVKGKFNEERVITLTRSLREKAPWIRRIKKAGTLFDSAGIDVKVFIRSPYGGKDVLVLMQVGSSLASAKRYGQNHPDCIKAGVIMVVVNDRKSDDRIKTSVLHALERVQKNPEWYERFHQLSTMVRNNQLPSFRPKRRKGKGTDHVDKCLFCVCKSRCEQSNCELSCSTG